VSLRALGWDYRITHSTSETDEEKGVYRNKYLQELAEFSKANNLGSNDAPTSNPGVPAAAAAKEAPPVSKPATPIIELDK